MSLIYNFYNTLLNKYKNIYLIFYKKITNLYLFSQFCI